LKHSRRLIAIHQAMERETRLVAAGMVGRVSLGLSSSMIYSDVPSRISAFLKSDPGIEVDFRVHGGDELRELLDQAELDAVITTLPVSGSEYLSRVISHQLMGAALHHSHPLASRKRLTLRALRNEQFVMVPREQHPTNHDALVARFGEFGAELRISVYETSFPNVLARVAIGQGVGLVAMGYHGDRKDAVRILPLDDPKLTVSPIYIASRWDNLDTAVERLIRNLSQAPSRAARRP
jgi:DNA-binding transcriptional LysR family regulator